MKSAHQESRELPPYRPRADRFRKGLKYEREVGDELCRFHAKAFIRSPWIRFEDAFGPGWAQPDGIIVTASAGAIIETKHTRCADAILQLRGLYQPLAAEVWPGRVWVLVQICKRWQGGGQPDLVGLGRLLDFATPSVPLLTINWMGDFIDGLLSRRLR